MSPEIRQQHGISHIISVCPEFKSTGNDHLSVPIDDCEYEDLLAHLPKCCEFIQHALDGGGKVLVHCVMGISRSTTVVAAYRAYITCSPFVPLLTYAIVMKARKLNPQAAIKFIKRCECIPISFDFRYKREIQTGHRCTQTMVSLSN